MLSGEIDNPEDEFMGNVDEMLNMLIELSAEKWSSVNYSKGYLQVHIKKLCDLHASKARIDTLTEFKNQMDEQKKKQEEGPKTQVRRGGNTSP